MIACGLLIISFSCPCDGQVIHEKIEIDKGLRPYEQKMGAGKIIISPLNWFRSSWWCSQYEPTLRIMVRNFRFSGHMREE